MTAHSEDLARIEGATAYMRTVLMSTGAVTLAQVDEYAPQFAKGVLAAADSAGAAHHRKYWGRVRSYVDRGLCGYPLGGSRPGTCVEPSGHDRDPGRTDHVSDGKR